MIIPKRMLPESEAYPRCRFSSLNLDLKLAAIVTIAVGISEPYNLCLDDSRHAYAERFAGVGYCVYVKQPVPTLAYGFNKLVAVMNTFGTFPELKHVLYLDANALIVNMDISILDIAQRYAAADIVFASEEFVNREKEAAMLSKTLGFPKSEIAKYPIQGGAMMFKNSARTAWLAEVAFREGRQWSLDFAHLSDRAAWIKTAIRNPDVFKRHVMILDPGVLESTTRDHNVSTPALALHAGGGGAFGFLTAIGLGGTGSKYAYLYQLCRKLYYPITPLFF